MGYVITYSVTNLIQEQKRLVARAYTKLSEEANANTICRLVYLLYPDFFLRGVEIKNIYYRLTAKGEVVTTKGDHYPSSYSVSILVDFLTLVAESYGYLMADYMIELFLAELEEDFSDAYCEQFPHVLRIVTGNTYKREEYYNAFFPGPVEFICYNFEEIQGTSEEIIKHKINQLPDQGDIVVMVDDTSLEMTALDGFPGPYVKSFFSQSSINQFSQKLEKLGNTTGFVSHTIALRKNANILIQKVSFPIVWKPSMRPGHSFDPYCCYRGVPIVDLKGLFRHILSFWIKVLLRRFDPSRGVT